MANRGTIEGDIQEIADVIYINSHKKEFVDFFKIFSNDINNLWIARVTTNQLSKLTNKVVKTRSDAFVIESLSDELNEEIAKGYLLDENILAKHPGKYKKFEKSGISIKLDDSTNFQILKAGPGSFGALFSNTELGAGASLFCKKEIELPKNEALLKGWNTTPDKMIAFFKEFRLSPSFYLDKDECTKIKNYSTKKIKELIDGSSELQKKIFNGIDVYEEPYCAYYFLQNKTISPLTYIPCSVTTGSGRSHGDYTIVLKP